MTNIEPVSAAYLRSRYNTLKNTYLCNAMIELKNTIENRARFNTYEITIPLPQSNDFRHDNSPLYYFFKIGGTEEELIK